MLIVDAHEDLAYNAITFGRDYTLSAEEIRRAELGTQIAQWNDDTLLGWPEYQCGQVAVVFSTLFAVPDRVKSGDWERGAYIGIEQAHQRYRDQVNFYYRLEEAHPDRFRLIYTLADLHAVLAPWNQGGLSAEGTSVEKPVGLVMLMEGAEGVRQPAELEDWWQWGVRIIGPSWAGNRFCGSTKEPGLFTAEGFALLEAMASIGFCLDLSHMDPQAALQALDIYPGRIIASHSNVRALLKGEHSHRQLPDRMLHGLLERDGVIGIVLFNKFLQSGWERGRQQIEVTLKHVVAHIDYVCQEAGDARHVGLGTDFDGGFGLQSVPKEVETIADLQKLILHLQEKGYQESDIAAIMGGNWLNLLQQVLPESV